MYTHELINAFQVTIHRFILVAAVRLREATILYKQERHYYYENSGVSVYF